jgi:hypothetical protein
MTLPRLRFTIRGMTVVVAVVGLFCFVHERVFVAYITQCYGGRTVPMEFVVVDAETRTPIPRAKLTLSARGSRRHDLETGSDGRAFLAFQPGCDERLYLLWGVVYTVHYSAWEVRIEADGYDRLRAKLGSYRGNTRYAHAVVPPPIVIQIHRWAPTL